MSLWLTATVYFALGCFLAGMTLSLYRLLFGPSAQDRVMAIDYMYLNGMLIILVSSILYAFDAYFEAALLISIFGFVSSAALAKFLLRGEVIE